MDFKELLNSSEYDFLRENERLGKRIILLGVSGSYGYGTEREGSDVDLRGVTLNMPSDLIGLTFFEQFEDRKTDTVIYSFNKFVRLLLDANPNIIEIIGLDDYLILTEPGKILLENKELFLTRRAASSFSNYAKAQLRRLQNAIARDSLPERTRQAHILESVNRSIENINRTDHDPRRNVNVYLDEEETELFIDASFEHYPLRKFNELANTMHSVVRDYDKAGHRNHKKDDDHLNKHAMHLVRLLMTGIEILEKGVIRTRRNEEELVLLRKIRNGDYMKDSVLVPEFFEIVSDCEERFAQAEKNTSLPDSPDMVRVNFLVEEVNRRVILEDS